MTLPVLHAVAVAAWLGVLAVEAVLETVAYRHAELRDATAVFHYWIDLVVELPLLVAIVGTGVALFGGRPVDAALVAKVAGGAIAVGANLVCLWVVVRRRRARDGADRDCWSRRLYACVAAGVPGGAVALVIGLVRAS